MNKSSHSTQLMSKGRTSNNMQLAELLVWCSLNGFVAILAVLGNSFVIAAFMRFKKLRTRTNYFVVGLAAADILVGLLSIPFWITTMVSIWLESVSWKKRSLLYRAFIALDVFSGIASILHLLLISLERLYAIGCPVRHRVSSTRSYILAASLSWCLTLIIKLSLTIFFVILLFIAAWTPFMVINIVMFFCRHCLIPNKVAYASKLLHYSNSAVNPLVNLSKPSTLSAAGDPWLTELSTVELVAWCVPCGVVALAAIFGNTLVLASFFLSTNIRHQVVMFVAGLALADVLVGAVSIPMWIYTLFLSWKTRRPAEDIWLTLIYDALDVFAALNSIFHLTAISIESYARIWLKAKTGLRNVPDTTKKMSFTLLIVIGLFVVAWTPFFAVRGILHFCQHFCVSWRLFYLTKLFHFSNSAMNPLVYGLRIPEYKV
ncbi:unnamed protein product, partial [Porites evermanni]